MKIIDWYHRNETAITWFLIGSTSQLLLNSLSRGHWGWSAWHFVLLLALLYGPLLSDKR